MAGIGIQAFSSENYGYEGSLSHRVKIIPEVLKENGYNTFYLENGILGETL